MGFWHRHTQTEPGTCLKRALPKRELIEGEGCQEEPCEGEGGRDTDYFGPSGVLPPLDEIPSSLGSGTVKGRSFRYTAKD